MVRGEEMGGPRDLASTSPSPSPTARGAGRSRSEQTLVEAALQVLNTADPVEKARLGEDAATRWLHGALSLPYQHQHQHQHHHLPIPHRPARLTNLKLLPPQLMPKRGKAGSLQSRHAILHSLVHTESWAIDLSWDIIARFGQRESMPNDFFTDFVKVAQDEGRHFTLLSARLQELGSYYGALPAHDGLWDSAIATSDDLLARLAIEHCVHEARGLDVLPTTILRFRNGGDHQTADLLETVVYPEEITHCAAGVKWFKYLCSRNSLRYANPQSLSSQNSCADEDTVEDQRVDIDLARLTTDEDIEDGEVTASDELDTVIHIFHDTVRRYFRGPLKPPFNEQARKAAGFGPEWYEPLATKLTQ